MKAKIVITASTDRAALVSRRAFNANVDQEGLGCRSSQKVDDWYHAGWFCREGGYLLFAPPAFGFRNGHLFGINGRHRALLLSRHADVFPMLLVLPDTWPPDVLAEIVVADLCEGQTVNLPDLPVNGTIEECMKFAAQGRSSDHCENTRGMLKTSAMQ